MDHLFLDHLVVGKDSGRRKRSVMFFILCSSLRTLDSGVCVPWNSAVDISPSTGSWLGLTWEYFFFCLHCSFLLSQNVNLEKYPVIFSSFSTMGTAHSDFACSFETEWFQAQGVSLSDCFSSHYRIVSYLFPLKGQPIWLHFCLVLPLMSLV